MLLLSIVKDWCLDFLFPKSRRVLALEKLSSSAIMETLPPAESMNDENTIALFDYKHPVVKELIWELKYGGNKVVAQKLGEVLYDVISQELDERHLQERDHRPVLMPIPISDKRRFERGWNQTELLAQAVKSQGDGKFFKYLPRQLIKLHHTESQTKTTSRSERLKNLTDSMQVIHPPRVTGRCIIVIDDVTTTGSTFAEARRALYAAGAKKVLCIAVAH